MLTREGVVDYEVFYSKGLGRWSVLQRNQEGQVIWMSAVVFATEEAASKHCGDLNALQAGNVPIGGN